MALIRRGRRSLPFTGRPFVEARGLPDPRWRGTVSLPFTGRPFVEAGTRGETEPAPSNVAALHRAALR